MSKTGLVSASMESASPSLNPWKLGGLSWKELAQRLWEESEKDDILGRGAQLAYYFLLALFPALIFLTALMGLIPFKTAMPELMGYLESVLPHDALSIMQKFLDQILKGTGAHILSLGLLGALWASSSGVTAIIEALNTAYDAIETRPFWRVRLLAIALTLGLAGLIIGSTTLVLYGAKIGAWIADLIGFGWIFKLGWTILQWPVIIGLMLFAAAMVYYLCPNVKQDWRWVTPGSVFAVGMWLVFSLAFKAYVENFGNYNAVYGSIAGVVVLMLWLYWNGIVLLFGGEINAEIQQAAHARR